MAFLRVPDEFDAWLVPFSAVILRYSLLADFTIAMLQLIKQNLFFLLLFVGAARSTLTYGFFGGYRIIYQKAE